MIKDRKIGSDRKQDSIPKFVLACKVAVFQADVESSVVCCTTLALYQAWSVPLLLSLPAASLCFSALYFPRCTSLYFHSSECFQIEMWFTWSITSKVCNSPCISPPLLFSAKHNNEVRNLKENIDPRFGRENTKTLKLQHFGGNLRYVTVKRAAGTDYSNCNNLVVYFH